MTIFLNVFIRWGNYNIRVVNKLLNDRFQVIERLLDETKTLECIRKKICRSFEKRDSKDLLGYYDRIEKIKVELDKFNKKYIPNTSSHLISSDISDNFIRYKERVIYQDLRRLEKLNYYTGLDKIVDRLKKIWWFIFLKVNIAIKSRKINIS